MMAMMMAAMNRPPQPPAPMPKFQPEKWPEITAPTPSAHSDHTRAWRFRPRFLEVVLVGVLIGDAADGLLVCHAILLQRKVNRRDRLSFHCCYRE